MKVIGGLLALIIIGVMIGCAIAVYRGAPIWVALGILGAPAAGCPAIIWAYERRATSRD